MMYDKSYCSSTSCDQKDCERNLRFHKPCSKIYTVSNLNEEENENCKYKITAGGE